MNQVCITVFEYLDGKFSPSLLEKWPLSWLQSSGSHWNDSKGFLSRIRIFIQVKMLVCPKILSLHILCVTIFHVPDISFNFTYITLTEIIYLGTLWKSKLSVVNVSTGQMCMKNTARLLTSLGRWARNLFYPFPAI